MGQRAVTVVEYVCDNPRCKAQRYSNPDVPDEEPDGISGTVAEVDRHGGREVTFWAHARSCISAAIVARLTAEPEGDGPQDDLMTATVKRQEDIPWRAGCETCDRLAKDVATNGLMESIRSGTAKHFEIAHRVALVQG